jgi:uncharacterized protein (UPF0333 family)
MFKYLNKKRQKGQSTLEYAILIVIIIGALLSIQVYIKRGVQGRLKSAADDIGVQFSPGNTNGVMKTVTSSKSRETFKSGVTNSYLTGNEVTNTITNLDIMNVQSEFWGNK